MNITGACATKIIRNQDIIFIVCTGDVNIQVSNQNLNMMKTGIWLIKLDSKVHVNTVGYGGSCTLAYRCTVSIRTYII